MTFLQKFQSDRQGTPNLNQSHFLTVVTDEQFADEKNFLLQKLAALKSTPNAGGGGGANGISAY
jgi:hypothetical protein